MLKLLERSVEFLTPESTERLIRGASFLHTAWRLSNILELGRRPVDRRRLLDVLNRRPPLPKNSARCSPRRSAGVMGGKQSWSGVCGTPAASDGCHAEVDILRNDSFRHGLQVDLGTDPIPILGQLLGHGALGARNRLDLTCRNSILHKAFHQVSPTGLEPVTFGSGDGVCSSRREARKPLCG